VVTVSRLLQGVTPQKFYIVASQFTSVFCVTETIKAATFLHDSHRLVFIVYCSVQTELLCVTVQMDCTPQMKDVQLGNIKFGKEFYENLISLRGS